MRPIPQLRSVNLDYLRVPHLNVGVFEAPRLSVVLNYPSNPQPALAAQLAAQFLAQDRLRHVDPASPVPNIRGMSPVRSTSARRTPGAASSKQPEWGLVSSFSLKKAAAPFYSLFTLFRPGES